MDLIHHLAAAIVELLADLGDPETAGGAFDQAYAELRFEIGDLPAQFRFGLADRPARRREAAMSDDFREIVEIIEILYDVLEFFGLRVLKTAGSAIEPVAAISSRNEGQPLSGATLPRSLATKLGAMQKIKTYVATKARELPGCWHRCRIEVWQ